MSTPLLVVIPCLNEAAHLAGLVRQLLSDNPNLPLKLVIADGGSTDGTLGIAQALCDEYNSRVILLANPKRRQSAAINLAVTTHGQGCEYLIRIDAHAAYPRDYCAVLLKEAQETQADSVVVAMNTQGKSPFQRAVAAAQNSKLGNGGSAHRNTGGKGRWVDHGHHALMRIQAFSAVGGYDESFTHNEDAELDIRLTKQGHRIWLTGATEIIYFPRDRAWPLFKQYFNYGRGRVRNLLKHRTKPKLRQLLPVVVAPAFALALASPVCAWLAAPLGAWSLLCLSYGVLLSVKLRLPLLAPGFAALIMHLSWSLGFWRGLIDHLLTRTPR